MAIKKSSRKRRHCKTSRDEETLFEKKPRVSKEHVDKSMKLVQSRHLLPIKEPSGKIIMQSVEIQEKETVPETPSTKIFEELDEVKLHLSKDELLSKRKKQIDRYKIKIAKIVQEVSVDPQNSLKSLKELRLLLKDQSFPESCATVQKLVIASLSCLFIDIIPGYRIRERTEKEKEVKLSKDVKKLTEYEEGLVQQYKSFLQILENMIKARRQPNGRNLLLSREAQQSVGKIAIHSLCELYINASHFNFHNNITMVLVPLANDDPDADVRKWCCDAICALFTSDKSGSPTLESVNVLSKVAKERGCKRLQSDFLKTLLSLRINKVDYSMVGHGKTKEDRKQEKALKKKLSKRDSKKMKKQMDIENELKEAAASEDQQQRTKFHTETIQHVFLIYFRILKDKARDSVQYRSILPVVLEGLAKFAHLINIDFFGDLLQHIQFLVTSGVLSLKEKLHCISTVFQILSGQGEVLSIDPANFYSTLFGLLHEVPFSVSQSSPSSKHGNDLDLLLDCIDMMLNKRRKQVTVSTLTAFIKRLATISMQLQPYRSSASVLEVVRKLLNSQSKTSSLFDIESEAIGSYDPNADDPDRCGSTSSVLWELHTMRRHYVPLVSKSAKGMLKEKCL